MLKSAATLGSISDTYNGEHYEMSFKSHFETDREQPANVTAYVIGTHRSSVLGRLVKDLNIGVKQWNPTETNSQGRVKPDLFLLSDSMSHAGLMQACHMHWSSGSQSGRNTENLSIPRHHYFIAELCTHSEKLYDKLFQIEKNLTAVDKGFREKDTLFPAGVDASFAAIIVNGTKDAFEKECKAFAKVMKNLSEEEYFVADLWKKERLVVCYVPFVTVYRSLRRLEEDVREIVKATHELAKAQSEFARVQSEHTQMLEKLLSRRCTIL